MAHTFVLNMRNMVTNPPLNPKKKKKKTKSKVGGTKYIVELNLFLLMIRGCKV